MIFQTSFMNKSLAKCQSRTVGVSAIPLTGLLAIPMPWISIMNYDCGNVNGTDQCDADQIMAESRGVQIWSNLKTRYRECKAKRKARRANQQDGVSTNSDSLDSDQTSCFERHWPRLMSIFSKDPKTETRQKPSTPSSSFPETEPLLADPKRQKPSTPSSSFPETEPLLADPKWALRAAMSRDRASESMDAMVARRGRLLNMLWNRITSKLDMDTCRSILKDAILYQNFFEAACLIRAKPQLATRNQNLVSSCIRNLGKLKSRHLEDYEGAIQTFKLSHPSEWDQDTESILLKDSEMRLNKMVEEEEKYTIHLKWAKDLKQTFDDLLEKHNNKAVPTTHHSSGSSSTIYYV